MLNIKEFTFNPFEEHTYVVYDGSTRDAIIVDPGMLGYRDFDEIKHFVEDNKLNINAITLTHIHLDHCFGAPWASKEYHVPIRAHLADAPLGASVPQQAQRFGLFSPTISPVAIDEPLAAGDVITLGDNTLEVLHVPGHTPGGIALYCRDGHFVIAGDSLFRGSIGRTDLPGGDYDTLIASIRSQLLNLPDDTVVYTGHSDATTIGDERRYNPFIR